MSYFPELSELVTQTITAAAFVHPSTVDTPMLSWIFFFFIWFGAFSKKCHYWKKKKSYVDTLADLIGKHLHWYFTYGRKPCSHIQVTMFLMLAMESR